MYYCTVLHSTWHVLLHGTVLHYTRVPVTSGVPEALNEQQFEVHLQGGRVLVSREVLDWLR